MKLLNLISLILCSEALVVVCAYEIVQRIKET